MQEFFTLYFGKDTSMIKRVAVINDLSGLGKCSLTAAIPVLSVMGVQACPLPTAVLTNQTGYDSYYCTDFTDKIDHYTEEWQKRGLTLDAISTGYLGNADQAEKILNFCEKFRTPSTLLFVDPVMGDSGVKYDIFTPSLQQQMQKLVSHADVITPNLTELCLLTHSDFVGLTKYKDEPDYLDRIARIAAPLKETQIQTIIVTGILYQAPSDDTVKYYNLVLENDQISVISSGIHGGSYSGTGDLLSAVVCASMVQGKSAAAGVEKACRFIERSLIDTVADQIPRNDGINFESHLSMLLD